MKIPGLVPGIFFFALAFSAAGGVALRLGEELFAEGQWAAARAEGLRALGEEGVGAEDGARARLLAARASLRMGTGREGAKADLGAVWNDEGAAMETRCAAACELGRAEWEDGARDRAFAALKVAFVRAREPETFWRAGCSLHFLAKEDGRIRKEDPALWQAVESCRDAWPAAVWSECRPAGGKGTGWGALPGRWLVKFYRAQVGPAIGSRCDLLPSCSEYMLRASGAHGLLGIAIMADRFVREPSVVSAREKPVTMPDGHVRYADPLEDHDFWMGGKR